MKIKYLILAGLILNSLQIFAQHPLVGTWQMVSMKGTDFDGKKISVTTSMAREIKIITPTHYMLIAHDVKGDSLVFNRSHAGLVRFENDQFIEIQKIASWDNLEPVSLPFHWKVEGDKFIQSGKITRADGKTAMLEELVFKRIKGKASYPGNPSNGTWDQLSARYTLGDGKEESHTNKTATRFQIITPTHWIRIHHRNNKFESAMAGSYQMEGNKVYSFLEQASYPINEGEKFEFTQRVEDDKLYVSGKAVFQDGNTLIWDDVFQKVDGDPLR